MTPDSPRIKLTGVAKLLARIVKLITPKRRWAQFSLATLFVVVTVLCIWLAWKTEHKRTERATVAEIRKLGGTIIYDWQCANPHSIGTPNGPAWLRSVFGEDFFSEVVIISVKRCPEFSDETIAELQKGLPNCRILR